MPCRLLIVGLSTKGEQLGHNVGDEGGDMPLGCVMFAEDGGAQCFIFGTLSWMMFFEI
jgi:hypothetical protein